MKNENLELRIGHLYPDLMDTYGDYGNIIALSKRCLWRGIATNYYSFTVGSDWKVDEVDLFFFGGGQDRAQTIAGKDLQGIKADQLIRAVEKGAALLSVCGGYQLLGKFYHTAEDGKIPGIGLFDAYTESGDKRMIGNLVIELNIQALDVTPTSLPQTTVVGFENHSGKTFLGKQCQPLGKVVVGYGNNDQDSTEGIIQNTAFGCYLHGSLLPKNPHLADLLVKLALKRRYGKVQLEPLDDSLEWQAHQAAVREAKRSKKTGLW